MAIFLITGMIKLTQPRQDGSRPHALGRRRHRRAVRAIGALEVLGVLGLILAAALNAPILTTLAATGLALTMVGAIATHARYRETERLAVPAVLLVVAIFVAIAPQGL